MDLKEKKPKLTCHILAMTSREHAKSYFLASFSSWQLCGDMKYSWSVWNEAWFYRSRNIHQKCRISYMVPFLTDVCLICSGKKSPGIEEPESLWSSLEIYFGLIVFLLSDFILLLLHLKLICFYFIPGECREQCVISMPLATLLNLMTNLKLD